MFANLQIIDNGIYKTQCKDLRTYEFNTTKSIGQFVCCFKLVAT